MSSSKVSKYNFEGEFQTKVASLCLRDFDFVRRTDGLIKPEYFEKEAESFLVEMSLNYYQKYGQLADNITFDQVVRSEFRDNKRVAESIGNDVLETLFKIRSMDLAGAAYVGDQITQFAQYQEYSEAILDSVDILQEGLNEGNAASFQKFKERIDKASLIGLNEDVGAVDYFENIDQRTDLRKAIVDGSIVKRSITTGIAALDKLLYHGGWGYQEVSLIMGPEKSGKSMALGEFARAAVMDGKNVLILTFEVSSKIYADRLDANISNTNMFDIESKSEHVKNMIHHVKASSGIMKIHSYPTGTFTPSALNRLLHRYKSQGMKFDMVVLDYIDLMKANTVGRDSIENSKSIYIDVRAIAQEQDIVILTATQINREGAKQLVATSSHVSDDINKVRIADLVISINKTDEEKAAGKARLYFAAGRNQADGFTLLIEQNMSKMKFISRLVEIR